jgi:glycerophosphoryl diester phosphodiesterase
LSSFSPEALEGAREAAPPLPRALLIDKFTDGWFERARSLGCVAVVANWRLFDLALVQRLHAAGLWAMCYTVNDAQAAHRLLDWGLDALITDAVDRFCPQRGRALA